jgi:hypothetical protein
MTPDASTSTLVLATNSPILRHLVQRKHRLKMDFETFNPMYEWMTMEIYGLEVLKEKMSHHTGEGESGRTNVTRGPGAGGGA